MKPYKFIICVIISLSSLFFASCLPSDEAISPYPRGEGRQVVLSMGATYASVLYYSLLDDTVVARVPIDAWHCAVSTGELPVIRMNSALVGSVQPTTAALGSALALPRTGWTFDAPDGSATAFGEWWKQPERWWIVHLGVNAHGRDLGHRVVRLERRPDSLVVHIRPLDGSKTMRCSVPTTGRSAWNGINLITAMAVESEPPRSTWDLAAQRYTHLFVDGPNTTPYAVTGILLADGVAAQRIPVADSITRQTADTMTLRSQRDIIGYDWKSYSIETGVFTTFQDRRWIVRTAAGLLFSVQPVDFYDEHGVKGTITMKVFPL